MKDYDSTNLSAKQIQDIARVAHETNRAYCQTLGDNSQVSWDAASSHARASCINGVVLHVDGKITTPEESHANWMRFKEADGWVYGKTKDEEAKTHHCLVPFSDLPLEQQLKDTLFTRVVHSMASHFLSHAR